MKSIILSRSLALLALLSACGTNLVSAAQPENEKQMSENELETGMTDQSEQLAHARSDLVTRLGIADEDITLLSTKSVTWRSGALGCPEKGRVYTQALVPGRLFVFRVGQKTYRYHADKEGVPFYCPNNRVETPTINPSDL